ncbi:hypothetical protein GCM10009678_04830 [Actinomadura kijaniata]|uniref:Uncharacterized protein n=1 Tax=Actinomadura namibiensis TaxID=182080 RepID=A0A7W3QPB1_ACTNM|nr:hypothetical protein [Actinomadura namibiensis]MBA8953953.1 hypothetical protein [Actinomadura namibiensis]
MSSDGSRYFDGQSTAWQLIWFGPDEWVAGTFPVTREQLLQLRHLFDYGDDEWFARTYPIEPHHWPTLLRVLSCPEPAPEYNYFIEGYATDL